jgi:threonine/homoserine/homoserine lactone efflux protein
MDGAFWKALAFGAILAGAIGPIALLIVETAARRGVAAGCFAGLGAALADLAFALLAFTMGALLLPLLDAHATAIRVACALLLIGLGLAMLLRRADPAVAVSAPRPAAQALLPTLLLTLVNPMTLAVFAGFVPQLPVAGSPPTAAWLAFALFAGSLLVQVALALAGSLLGAVLPGARWQRLISRASALGVLGFGLAGLYAAT